jgi:hypothetical protein
VSPTRSSTLLFGLLFPCGSAAKLKRTPLSLPVMSVPFSLKPSEMAASTAPEIA